MSRDIGVGAFIYADYTYKNIKKILEQGIILGFTYFDHDVDKLLYQDAPLIDAAAAAKKIVTAYETRNEYGPSVYVKLFEDSYIFIHMYNEHGLIHISLGPFNYHWRRATFFTKYEHDIDFVRVLNRLLSLLEPFCIQSIETYYYY